MQAIKKLAQSRWFTLADVTPMELNLERTIMSGQCFNWFPIAQLLKLKCQDPIPTSTDAFFIGVLNGSVVGLRSHPSTANQARKKLKIEFCLWSASEPKLVDIVAMKEYLVTYFQLKALDLPSAIAEWQQADPAFQLMSNQLIGLRVLRQEPFECLISYICSQNNNFIRIQKILLGMREKYGSCLGAAEFDINGKAYSALFYDFPTLEQLLEKANTHDLQTNCGLGYRARYIIAAIERLKQKGGEKWLSELQGQHHNKVQRELCEFQGIGKKVADCIALFSLRVPDAIGIDTHVLQITKRFYPQSLGGARSLTPKLYDQVSGFYRKRFGKNAGWAANILFSANKALGMSKLAAKVGQANIKSMNLKEEGTEEALQAKTFKKIKK